MRLLYILGGLVLILTTSCLKKDILSEELEGSNFQESAFYTSGDFQNELDLIATNVEITKVADANNDTLCQPVLSLHLRDSYADELSEYWKHDIRIEIDRNPQDPTNLIKSYPLENGRYISGFQYQHPAIQCNGSVKFEFRIKLISPEDKRVVAFASKMFSLPI